MLDEFQEKILLDGCTTNTVIHYHAIFGKAFKDAVRKDYLETNPMLKVDRPKKNSFRPTSTPRMRSSSCWKSRRMTRSTCAFSSRPITVCAGVRCWG